MGIAQATVGLIWFILIALFLMIAILFKLFEVTITLIKNIRRIGNI